MTGKRITLAIQESHSEDCASLRKMIEEGKERLLQEQTAHSLSKEELQNRENNLQAEINDLQGQISSLEANLGRQILSLYLYSAPVKM